MTADTHRPKTIVVIGTLDTKGTEVAYVRDCVERHGHRALVVDGGVLGTPGFTPAISRDELARAAGSAS